VTRCLHVLCRIPRARVIKVAMRAGCMVIGFDVLATEDALEEMGMESMSRHTASIVEELCLKNGLDVGTTGCAPVSVQVCVCVRVSNLA